MKILLEIEGVRPPEYDYDRDCEEPVPAGADRVRAAGRCPCARCQADPFFVRGSRPNVGTHGAKAEASCCACGQPVGTLHVEFDTIFGVDEDARVLSGAYGKVI